MPRARLRLLILTILITSSLVALSAVSAQEANSTTSINDQSAQTTDHSPQNSPNNEPNDALAQSQPANRAENGTQKAAELNLPSFSYKDTKETSLGRSLVLSIGFFPFTYFYTGFVLDISRFVAHNFSTAYAPWPFTTQYSVALTDSEMWIKLGIASLSSLVLGVLGTLIK